MPLNVLTSLLKQSDWTVNWYTNCSSSNRPCWEASSCSTNICSSVKLHCCYHSLECSYMNQEGILNGFFRLDWIQFYFDWVQVPRIKIEINLSEVQDSNLCLQGRLQSECNTFLLLFSHPPLPPKESNIQQIVNLKKLNQWFFSMHHHCLHIKL